MFAHALMFQKPTNGRTESMLLQQLLLVYHIRLNGSDVTNGWLVSEAHHEIQPSLLITSQSGCPEHVPNTTKMSL